MRKALYRSVGFCLAVLITACAFLFAFPFSMPTVSAVSTVAALQSAIAAGSDIALTADIRFSDTDTWTASAYSGTFNGNGHVIIGLKQPLFHELSGNVSNVGLITNGSINDTAILARVVNGGSVTNCFSYGTLAYSGTAKPHVGGLVGTLQSGEVTGSFSCVTIDTEAASYVGGLIGMVKDGTVSSCYSSGVIEAQTGTVAGFANQIGGTVSDTYASCQLRYVYSHAKPSGVDGLYDNQLSVMRESADNSGLATKALMTTAELPAAFAVTSTAYPALHAFYGDSWSDTAKEIVRVSVAAAAFSDVDVSKRMEPDNFAARADYLTRDVYIDRTNTNGLRWSIDSSLCKLYDTVPVTSALVNMNAAAGTSADLLRARVQFSADTIDATTGAEAPVTMTAASTGGYQKLWYLSSYESNPYFDGGKGIANAAFEIGSATHLDHVRYYALMDAVEYKVVSDIAVGDFEPIVDMSGHFDGDFYTLSDITVADTGVSALGLFASTQSGTVIEQVVLQNVTAVTQTASTIGALIGSANATTVQDVMLVGANNTVSSKGIAGGLIGTASDSTLSHLLLSVETSGEGDCGGIVGQLSGGSLKESGVTGLVTGSAALGGIVGTVDSAAVIADCYSTTAVFSTATDAAVGAFVGNADVTASVNDSYAASFVKASKLHFVGSGAVAETCYYDSDLESLSSGTAVNTAGLMSDTALPTATWTMTDDHYPQITYFASSEILKELSALSTQPVYFQKYWEDDKADNMTTGWIASAYSAEGSLAEPVLLVTYSAGDAEVYDVNSGFGFEAAGGSDRIVLKAEDSNVGIRVFGATRKDMYSISYTILGNAVDVNTYLEIYYSADKTAWNGSQIMVLSSDMGSDEPRVLYDMPGGSYIKVRVRTVDDYAVKGISIGDTELTAIGDGYYISKDANGSEIAYSQDVTVQVELEAKTPPWGLHRESY